MSGVRISAGAPCRRKLRSACDDFFRKAQKSPLTRSTAPPFQIEPTSLGFDLVLPFRRSVTVCFQLIGNSEEVLLNCFIKNSGHLPSSAVAASAASRRALNLSRFSARSAAKAGVRISAGAPRRRKLRSACDDFFRKAQKSPLTRSAAPPF